MVRGEGPQLENAYAKYDNFTQRYPTGQNDKVITFWTQLGVNSNLAALTVESKHDAVIIIMYFGVCDLLKADRAGQPTNQSRLGSGFRQRVKRGAASV